MKDLKQIACVGAIIVAGIALFNLEAIGNAALRADVWIEQQLLRTEKKPWTTEDQKRVDLAGEEYRKEMMRLGVFPKN